MLILAKKYGQSATAKKATNLLLHILSRSSDWSTYFENHLPTSTGMNSDSRNALPYFIALKPFIDLPGRKYGCSPVGTAHCMRLLSLDLVYYYYLRNSFIAELGKVLCFQLQ